MRLLLDTHVAAWWWENSPRLPKEIRKTIRSCDEAFVSAVSMFEIATKGRLGKWPGATILLARFDDLMVEDDFTALPVVVEHARAAGTMAGEHKDPFDRLLAAQAVVAGLTLVSADPAFRSLDVPTFWRGSAS